MRLMPRHVDLPSSANATALMLSFAEANQGDRTVSVPRRYRLNELERDAANSTRTAVHTDERT
jgi:hypothetical protein